MEKELLEMIERAESALEEAGRLLGELKSRLSQEPENEDLPADEPEDLPETEPIDIEIGDLPQEEPAAPAAAAVPTEEAVEIEEPAPIAVKEEAPAPAPEESKATAGYLWETDNPGSKVSNILSAISLNDRVLFINLLFREDAQLFRDTVSALNSMNNFDEARQYVRDRFREWNPASETVYRFMMALRRRFQ